MSGLFHSELTIFRASLKTLSLSPQPHAVGLAGLPPSQARTVHPGGQKRSEEIFRDDLNNKIFNKLSGLLSILNVQLLTSIIFLLTWE